MFTWICPQCGREVPPSYSECPTCAERRQQGGQPQAPQPAPQQPQYAPQPPQQPQYAPQQPQYAPQPPVYAPAPPQQTGQFPTPQQPAIAAPQYMPPQQPQYAAPQPQAVYTLDEQKKGLPTWLVGILTVAVLGGALFGLYKYVGKGSSGGTAATPARSEADSKAAAGHPYRKYIEIAGLRILENSARKPVIRYTVVNHSPAELQNLELQLTLTSTSGAEPLSIIKAKVGTVDAYGVKDMESPLETKLKIYELPDWQFVKAAFEITAPK
jgi:hypothetical protein